MSRASALLVAGFCVVAAACVDDRNGPAASIHFRSPTVPSDGPVSLQPGGETDVVVQALNSDKNPVNGVQIFMVNPDSARFDLAPETSLTDRDNTSGLFGAARFTLKVKANAPYGNTEIVAVLTQWETSPDAGVPADPVRLSLPLAVVADTSALTGSMSPAASVTVNAGATQVLTLQVLDARKQPTNGIQVPAELAEGADAVIEFTMPSGASTQAPQASAPKVVDGVQVEGVVQWTIRAKPVTTAAVAHVIAGQFGTFDIHVTP